MQKINVQCMQTKRMPRQLWVNFEKLRRAVQIIIIFVASHQGIDNRCFASKSTIAISMGLLSVINSQYHLVKRPWGSRRDTSLFVVRCTTGPRILYNASSLDQ